MATDPPPRPDPEHPVVEPAPTGPKQEVGRDQLELGIRQQELLSELGVMALQRTTFDELLQRATHIAAEGLDAELCKILEFLPDENCFLLRAGVGWDPGLIGVARIGADLASPSGYALQTGKPVISNHLEHEERFRTPDLLKAHGVRRAINVILQGEGKPYGVLEVDSRNPGEFSDHDITFLQGAANILGMAIERQRADRSLRAALVHHKVLLSEINHRVKNSLQLVASMFSLQAGSTQDATVAQSLKEAVSRVTAVARIHERLYRSSDVRTIDLTSYIGDICGDLAELIPRCHIAYSGDQSIRMATDRAVRVALLATELMTNAVKHAYPEGQTGQVHVQLTCTEGGDVVTLSVRDEGNGLPASFDPTRSSGLGMRIINAMVAQTKGKLLVRSCAPGSEFLIEIPIHAED